MIMKQQAVDNKTKVFFKKLLNVNFISSRRFDV